MEAFLVQRRNKSLDLTEMCDDTRYLQGYEVIGRSRQGARCQERQHVQLLRRVKEVEKLEGIVWLN